MKGPGELQFSVLAQDLWQWKQGYGPIFLHLTKTLGMIPSHPTVSEGVWDPAAISNVVMIFRCARLKIPYKEII